MLALLLLFELTAVFILDRDGIPPYRIRKQHRREMQESVQVNGRVPLPHIPVSTGSAALSPSSSPLSVGLVNWCAGKALARLPTSRAYL